MYACKLARLPARDVLPNQVQNMNRKHITQNSEVFLPTPLKSKKDANPTNKEQLEPRVSKFMCNDL